MAIARARIVEQLRIREQAAAAQQKLKDQQPKGLQVTQKPKLLAEHAAAEKFWTSNSQNN
jgi:hypothetical protein